MISSIGLSLGLVALPLQTNDGGFDIEPPLNLGELCSAMIRTCVHIVAQDLAKLVQIIL